jgi:hypothetical protein
MFRMEATGHFSPGDKACKVTHIAVQAPEERPDVGPVVWKTKIGPANG